MSNDMVETCQAGAMSKAATTRRDPDDPGAPEDEVLAMVRDWARERPDIDMSSLDVFLRLRRALQAAERRRSHVLVRHGVTPATLDLLVALRRAGLDHMATPSQLARSLVLTASGVSQRLDRLEQAGLVTRTVNRADRRVIWVQLTDSGVQVLDDLIAEYMAHEEQMLQGLTDRQRADLARLLAQLNQSIEAVPEAAGSARKVDRA
jgi:DNA-binding MarR family transcriptional regulator